MIELLHQETIIRREETLKGVGVPLARRAKKKEGCLSGCLYLLFLVLLCLALLSLLGVILEHWQIVIAIIILCVILWVVKILIKRPMPVLQLSEVDSMDGHDFEYYCADLLQYAGFENIYVTPESGDQGVDIIAYKDNEKYAIQCKRYSGKLGNTPVQEVFTGKTMYHCSKAMVLTNSYFTISAQEAANATDVILWDREMLGYLISNKEQTSS